MPLIADRDINGRSPTQLTNQQTTFMDTKKVSAAVEAAKQLKELHTELTVRKADLERQKTVIDERNKVIYRMPLTGNEVKEFIFNSIDRQAAEFVRSAGWQSLVADHLMPKGLRRSSDHGALGKIDGPLNLLDVDNNRAVIDLGIGSNFFNGVAGSDSQALDARRAYFFFGDVIKAKIEQRFASLLPTNAILKRLIATDDGLTIEQKRAELASNAAQTELLDSEIEKVDAQLLEVDGFSVYPKPNPHPYV